MVVVVNSREGEQGNYSLSPASSRSADPLSHFHLPARDRCSVPVSPSIGLLSSTAVAQVKAATSFTAVRKAIGELLRHPQRGPVTEQALTAIAELKESEGLATRFQAPFAELAKRLRPIRKNLVKVTLLTNTAVCLNPRDMKARGIVSDLCSTCEDSLLRIVTKVGSASPEGERALAHLRTSVGRALAALKAHPFLLRYQPHLRKELCRLDTLLVNARWVEKERADWFEALGSAMGTLHEAASEKGIKRCLKKILSPTFRRATSLISNYFRSECPECEIKSLRQSREVEKLIGVFIRRSFESLKRGEFQHTTLQEKTLSMLEGLTQLKDREAKGTSLEPSTPKLEYELWNILFSHCPHDLRERVTPLVQRLGNLQWSLVKSTFEEVSEGSLNGIDQATVSAWWEQGLYGYLKDHAAFGRQAPTKLEDRRRALSSTKIGTQGQILISHG